jgi:ATP-dependent Clp protease ATP-binding subunit ClpX
MEDVKLEFTKEALNSIASRSMEKKLGARGLRSIIEDLMLDLMFHLPSSKQTSSIRITKKMVEDNSLVFDSLKRASGV